MELVGENDCYASESTIECYKNGICTLYLHRDYKIFLYHQVVNLIIKKKIIIIIIIRACSRKLVGVMENATLLTDCKVLPHHDDWSKDEL